MTARPEEFVPDGGRPDPITVFIIAGEESGDILGADLMRSLKARFGEICFLGVGGDRMQREGLASLFPMRDIVLHGLSEVLVRAPNLFRRIRQATEAIVEAKPAALVLVDCPGFNLRVAKKVRRRVPGLPIIDYVSPSVWAWAPWRAPRMARFVDHLLAILPFEPEVHKRLGGPPTTFIGHPLMERVPLLRGEVGERMALGEGVPPTLLVLPGSRRSEIRRLMDRFGETVHLLSERLGRIEVVLPAVEAHVEEIAELASTWPVQPIIVRGEEAKQAAFRRANVALAASGTVTLELALAKVPMVVAYRVDVFLRVLKRFLQAHSIVLANLIAGNNSIPELLDNDASPERLASTLTPLFNPQSAERLSQLAAFDEIERRMTFADGTTSDRAADIVARVADLTR